MRAPVLTAWFGAVAIGTPAVMPGQGFGLNEIGTCAVGRTSAGVASPCRDGSAIFWNPAATTLMLGTVVAIGGSAIAVNGTFTADTSLTRHASASPVAYPPYLFATRRLGARAAIGLGVYVPYGLTSQWQDDFPGRFFALEAALRTVYIQPNLAIEVVPGRVSIGGGPVFGYSTIELRQALDLSAQVAATTPDTVTFGRLGIPGGTEFARVSVEGSAVAVGVHVGVHVALTPTLSLGARYLSRLRFDFDDAEAVFAPTPTGLILAANNPLGLPAGTALDDVLARQFVPGGALVPQGFATTVPHPAQLQVGVAFTALPRTRVLLDYARIEWSAFEELPVRFEGPAAASNRSLIQDYEDASVVRTAVEHDFVSGWSARAGFSFNRAPVPDEAVTPLLPDMDRYVAAGGISVPIAERFIIDAAYLRVDTRGRRGRVVDRADRSQSAAELNGGFYTLDADIFSLGVRVRL